MEIQTTLYITPKAGRADKVAEDVIAALELHDIRAKEDYGSNRQRLPWQTHEPLTDYHVVRVPSLDVAVEMKRINGSYELTMRTHNIDLTQQLTCMKRAIREYFNTQSAHPN